MLRISLSGASVHRSLTACLWRSTLASHRVLIDGTSLMISSLRTNSDSRGVVDRRDECVKSKNKLSTCFFF